MCVTWFIHMCAMTHSSYVRHDALISETWLIHMCDPHDSDVLMYVTWQLENVNTHTDRNVTFMRVLDPILCVTWLIHMCDITHSYICNYSFIRVPRLWHTIAMATAWHSYLWHDSIIRVPWLIYMCVCDIQMCAMIHVYTRNGPVWHSHVWHDSFICVAWLIHMCVVTHSCVYHDPQRPSVTFIRVTWLIHMFAMTHVYTHKGPVWHSYVW